MGAYRYTEEEHAFLKEYVPGHSYKEIQEEFIRRFRGIKVTQVAAYIKKHKLKTGRTGRFEKGHTPCNKGKKGQYSPGSEKGWFKKVINLQIIDLSEASV